MPSRLPPVSVSQNICSIDLSNNPIVATRGISALHRLLCRNTSIVNAQFTETVPRVYRIRLLARLKTNQTLQLISREQFYDLKQVIPPTVTRPSWAYLPL